jgi:hypothetical protein
MFRPQTTRALRVDGPQKTLLYSHPGWGKTTQAAYYKARYGKGLVISGEAGLRSLMFDDIDYVPFSSWDKEHDPTTGVYSFRGICRDMGSSEFKALGYKWIMVDSWTEVAERCIEELEPKYAGSKNGFAMWGEYSSMMLGAAKWIRDQPLHVLVTALAKEEQDDNGGTDYWPSVKGGSVSKALPGIFDFVFAGVRITGGDKAAPQVERFVCTEEVRGWHGKARDPRRRLKAVERCSDVTELLERVAMADEDFDKYLKATKAAQAAVAAAGAAKEK